jgi:hypothetical protein
MIQRSLRSCSSLLNRCIYLDAGRLTAECRKGFRMTEGVEILASQESGSRAGKVGDA